MCAREKRVVRGVSATGHAKTPGERKNKNRVKKEQTTLFHLFVYYVFFPLPFRISFRGLTFVVVVFFFPRFLTIYLAALNEMSVPETLYTRRGKHPRNCILFVLPCCSIKNVSPCLLRALHTSKTTPPHLLCEHRLIKMIYQP